MTVRALSAALVGVAWSAASCAAVPPLHRTIEQRIEPQLAELMRALVRDGRASRLNGVMIFNGEDKFLPGKIALGLTNYLCALPVGDPRLHQGLHDFRALARLTLRDDNTTWGIYYYLSALNRLRERGYLAQAVDPETLAELRTRLDWRSFADPQTYRLKGAATNYYGVAIGISLLRYRMGWEGRTASERLFARLGEHYETYSAFGFSDETDGEGRFDRYSILLAAELAEHSMETGLRPPPQVRAWLRKSADVMMMRLNPDGAGFEYGRSAGPYSETAIVEVLTAAAALNLLQPWERNLAYAFTARVAQRYVEFWIDPATGSVDLWGQGRRTDAYRGKFRVLGENLSLANQFLAADQLWSRLGYQRRMPDAGWTKLLKRLPSRQVTIFAKGTYDRLLLTLRDRGQVIGLPIINGGSTQHMNSPYYPIPYANGMVAGVADGQIPQLTPQFETDDGALLMPLAYIQAAKVSPSGARTTVTYRISAMDRLGQSGPRADTRLTAQTTYRFEPGKITRTDVYTPASPLALKDVVVQFAGFGAIDSSGATAFTYADGAVRRFEVTGLKSCEGRALDRDPRYESPNGPMNSLVTCRTGPLTLNTPLTVTWSLSYGFEARKPDRTSAAR